MTQLAQAFDTANPQDATTTATESTESAPEQEIVTSEPESEEQESTEQEVEEKPEFKPGSPKTVPIERFNEIYGQMRRLDRLAMTLLEERKAQKAPEKPPKVEEEEVDLEAFTPRELVDYIRRTNRRDMEELLEQSVTPLKEDVKLRNASESITRAAAKYKDFFKYRDAMIEIGDKHPKLDAEELYLIASGRKEAAGDKIMTRVKEKVEEKKNALTTKHTSSIPSSRTPQNYRNIREGALAAAKELGYNTD